MKHKDKITENNYVFYATYKNLVLSLFAFYYKQKMELIIKPESAEVFMNSLMNNPTQINILLNKSLYENNAYSTISNILTSKGHA